MRARDIMTKAVRTVTPDTLVREIAQLLAKWHISAVPVVDRRRHVVGIVSEGDLLHRREIGTARRPSWWLRFFADPRTLAQQFAKSRAVWARDVMTRPVVAVTPNANLADVADLLEQRGIKRVPVVQRGRLVGIVSRGDIVRALARRPKAGAKRKASDATISMTFQRELALADGVSGALVNFAVSNGAVELSGLVANEDQRTAIRVLAETIPGVQRVTNRVAIIPRAGA